MLSFSIFGPFILRIETYFGDNISTPDIFKKLMVLTLERVKTDFDLTNLVTVLVHCKNYVLGGIVHLFVRSHHIYILFHFSVQVTSLEDTKNKLAEEKLGLENKLKDTEHKIKDLSKELENIKSQAEKSMVNMTFRLSILKFIDRNPAVFNTFYNVVHILSVIRFYSHQECGRRNNIVTCQAHPVLVK